MYSWQSTLTCLLWTLCPSVLFVITSPPSFARGFLALRSRSPVHTLGKERHTLPDKTSDSCHLNHGPPPTTQIPSRNLDSKSKQWSTDERTRSLALNTSCLLLFSIPKCTRVDYQPQTTSTIYYPMSIY